MKLILKPQLLRLEAENFADKLYIHHFLKKIEENRKAEIVLQRLKDDNFAGNIGGSFQYSNRRTSPAAPKGGGWFDVNKVLPEIWDADEQNKEGIIAVEEIESLEILNYKDY